MARRREPYGSRSGRSRVSKHSWSPWVSAFRVALVAGLLVDVYVHWDLASRFDTLRGAASPHISQGQLFRVEAGLALLAAVLVMVSRRPLATAFALVVAAGGTAVVVLYAVVDVGGFGPIPNMYDPAWYAEKTLSAVAEGVAALAALLLLSIARPRPTGQG